jgi:hypothetical protein
MRRTLQSSLKSEEFRAAKFEDEKNSLEFFDGAGSGTVVACGRQGGMDKYESFTWY